ncbi:MAG: DUF2867 domain-containing protein [Burkholderiales bacterium]|nr:DUF2867 domain-containing protein [Burkholderiales bacterium]
MGPAIRGRLPGAYFHDCHVVRVPASDTTALGHFLQVVARTPRWVNLLMALRNRTVALFGLKNLGALGGFDPAKPESAYRPGERVGIFTLIQNTPDEVLLGDDDKHLEVVLSVFKGPVDAAGQVRVSVTTVVHVHNLLGRLYMLPVTPLHRLIAPAVLARAGRADPESA